VAVEVSAFTVSGSTGVARVVEDDPAVTLGALVLVNSGRGWLRARVRAGCGPGGGPGLAQAAGMLIPAMTMAAATGVATRRTARQTDMEGPLRCACKWSGRRTETSAISVSQTDNDVFPAVRRVDGRRPQEYAFSATATAPNSIPQKETFVLS